MVRPPSYFLHPSESLARTCPEHSSHLWELQAYVTVDIVNPLTEVQGKIQIPTNTYLFTMVEDSRCPRCAFFYNPGPWVCGMYPSPHFSLRVSGYEVSLKRLFRVGLAVVDKIFINQNILRGLRFAQKATIELELTLSKKVYIFLRLVNMTFLTLNLRLDFCFTVLKTIKEVLKTAQNGAFAI